MKPILTLASTRPLVSLDVWALSLNNRSEVLAKKFSSLKLVCYTLFHFNRETKLTTSYLFLERKLY